MAAREPSRKTARRRRPAGQRGSGQAILGCNPQPFPQEFQAQIDGCGCPPFGCKPGQVVQIGSVGPQCVRGVAALCTEIAQKLFDIVAQMHGLISLDHRYCCREKACWRSPGERAAS